MYAWRRVDSSSKRATEVISYVEERAARLAIDNAARRSRCPRTGVGGLRGRAAERLVEPCRTPAVRPRAVRVRPRQRRRRRWRLSSPAACALTGSATSRTRRSGRTACPAGPALATWSPAYEAAHQVCKHDLPDIGPHTSAEKTTAARAALRYATCMRSNGLPNFPDPDSQGVIQVSAVGTLEPSSPQFEKAETACRSLENGVAQQSSEATAGSSPPTGTNGTP